MATTWGYYWENYCIQYLLANTCKAAGKQRKVGRRLNMLLGSLLNLARMAGLSWEGSDTGVL